MRGVSKKMFISILTSVIVMVTMVATTFAWVGIFTYANTEKFNLNLKVSELDANYFLTISSSGKKGTFSDEIDIFDVKKKILMNMNDWDENFINSKTNAEIDMLYGKYSTTVPSTALVNDNNEIDFYSIDTKNSDHYSKYTSKKACIKFDIYLSVDTKEGIKYNSETGLVSDNVQINSNVFLTELENTIVGTLCKQKLTNLNPFKKMDDLPSIYNSLVSLPDNDYFNINSANSTRFALCLYDPISIDQDYTGNEYPNKTLIYHGGNQTPNVNRDVYDLGGILPEEYNVALNELLIIRPNYKNGVINDYNIEYANDLSKAIQRGSSDLDLEESNSKIWFKPSDADVDNKPYLGVHNGIQTKQKITVCFWFEGWDADCAIGINEMPVTLNLTFTAGIEE